MNGFHKMRWNLASGNFGHNNTGCEPFIKNFWKESDPLYIYHEMKTLKTLGDHQLRRR